MGLSITVITAMTALASGANAAKDEVPPLTPDLINAAGVACVRIDNAGSVTGAFLIATTGDPGRDQHLLDWVQRLHWPAAEPGEKLRNTWFPMPIAIGSAKLPQAPRSCSPNLQTPAGSQL